jgi:hypothetical protein
MRFRRYPWYMIQTRQQLVWMHNECSGEILEHALIRWKCICGGDLAGSEFLTDRSPRDATGVNG